MLAAGRADVPFWRFVIDRHGLPALVPDDPLLGLLGALGADLAFGLGLAMGIGLGRQLLLQSLFGAALHVIGGRFVCHGLTTHGPVFPVYPDIISHNITYTKI